MAPGQNPSGPWMGVTLARILRARGRIGEVAAEILTDFPERLSQLREVWLWDSAHPERPARHAKVRAFWLHKDQAVFHFEGCESIGDAEKLRGLDVQLPLAERVSLPQGKYYLTDLTGCEVWESAVKLGVVTDVQLTGEELPGTPVLVVETKGGELLIPLAEEICRRIDVGGKRIDVVLPEGLRELNR